MGVIRNQSIKNSINFYIGMSIGAVNTILIYPNVFNDQPEHWGLLSILVAYATLIGTFSSLGIPKTFIRFFPAIKEKGQLYFLSLIIPLFGFLLSCLGYWLFKGELFVLLNASQLLQDNFFYIFLLVFFISFYDVLTSISRSYLDASTPIFLNEIFLKFFSLILLVLHGYKLFDFTTFLQLYVCGFLFKFLLLFILQFIKGNLYLKLSLGALKIKEIIGYGFYVLIGGASVMFVSRLDMIMIGALLGLEHVAFYTLAFYIGSVIKVPGKSIFSISVPLLAKAWEEQDFMQIQTIYSKSSINQLIIGGLFFLCVWINIDAIFSILPEKFSHGKWVVLCIGLAQLFNVATGVNGAIIVNSKYYKYDLYTNLLLVVITLISNYLLIPKYGINGAAMATAFSVLLFNLIRLILIKLKMNLQPFSLKTLYTV
ncbi:oligosaccharide flippase family protein, partial [Flavobacteriales bacterium]|nr:oligosaccharide flippase family protein [Flavobacteriales bacterium]